MTQLPKVYTIKDQLTMCTGALYESIHTNKIITPNKEQKHIETYNKQQKHTGTYNWDLPPNDYIEPIPLIYGEHYSGGVISNTANIQPMITNEQIIPLPNTPTKGTATIIIGNDTMVMQDCTVSISPEGSMHNTLEDWTRRWAEDQVRFDAGNFTTFPPESSSACESDGSVSSRSTAINETILTATAKAIDAYILRYWMEEDPISQMAREAIASATTKLAHAQMIGSIEIAKRKPRLLMLTGE